MPGVKEGGRGPALQTQPRQRVSLCGRTPRPGSLGRAGAAPAVGPLLIIALSGSAALFAACGARKQVPPSTIVLLKNVDSMYDKDRQHRAGDVRGDGLVRQGASKVRQDSLPAPRPQRCCVLPETQHGCKQTPTQRVAGPAASRAVQSPASPNPVPLAGRARACVGPVLLDPPERPGRNARRGWSDGDFHGSETRGRARRSAHTARCSWRPARRLVPARSSLSRLAVAVSRGKGRIECALLLSRSPSCVHILRDRRSCAPGAAMWSSPCPH